MTEDALFDDMRPSTWLDAFPWLKGVVGDADETWWIEPMDDTDRVTHRRRLAAISELAMAHLSRWTISQILPGLPASVDLLHLELPVRAANALTREGCRRAGDLLGTTLGSMMEWRQVGVGTIDAILQALADVSSSLATPTVVTQTATSTVPRTAGEPGHLTDWSWDALYDLTKIASWYATAGLTDRPLLGEPIAPGAPDEVVKARERLERLRTDDVVDKAGTGQDAAALFDDVLAGLDPRAARVLADRLFADQPATLDEIGQALGVTRERVRQIEGKARGAMLSNISDGSALKLIASTARTLIGTIRPLDELLALVPALGNRVESVGQPAWRVLDRLDDAYEIEDGWCVVPTMTAAQAATQTQLQECADPYGVVRLDELDLVQTTEPDHKAELTAAWLTYCGYVVDEGHVIMRTHSVGDYGAAVLAIVGSPLSAQEIVDRFIFERSPGSLRNAMSSDDRFDRVDRDRWALKEWGLETYAGIRSVLREQVARRGGHADLNELIEYITGQYSVTASSVIAYASTPPFSSSDGVVRMAAGDRSIRKTPERTRRLFRRPDGWAYRVRITPDHLRGSGSVAPVAIATILDMQFGQTRYLESPLGPQTIAWSGTQPQFGTIRRFLMDQDVAVGAESFLVMHDDATFSFEAARELTGNPLLDALSLVGAPMTVDLDAARAALTAAISLPEASPVSSIIGGYRERGDGDIADLLTSVRQDLEAGQVGERPTRRADVDEILNLL
ncbi:sigma factor-like helix-turn-helix DNA-binding protein [Jiangella alkaliphila]|uniref:RNA polymerase, alpha chain C terminal domain n=1 Tax=Jiangella alkaliphila TaxID=419479 RepID=A0A1H2IVT3_9ACTN|nr:sigma factor-like helix-turn-helix DNA-binding protein [Jiangella alkaliphila]SDU48253.1 RNA polymerase, alpha chain C terminal domain [Jiangella alkaliphila]